MADMTELRREVATFVERVAADAVDVVYRATVAAAPEKSGFLKHEIDTEPVTMVSEFTAATAIFCDADYAGYTDAGTPPHRIPGNPWLSFFWERENVDVVFASRDGHPPAYVNHPGTAGTQWFNGGEDDGDPMRTRWERATELAAAAIG